APPGKSVAAPRRTRLGSVPMGGSDTVVAALRASKAAFAEVLSTVPGATRREEAGLAWVDTGRPDAAFNGVYRAPAGPGLAPAADRVVCSCRDRGRPFHWELGLSGEPAGAAAVLTGAGLRHDEDEPGMWLDLRTMPEPPAAVEGLAVRPVTDRDRLR